jgi:hypothetical protein
MNRKKVLIIYSWVDFVKQFMPCVENLRSAPILLWQIYSNLGPCTFAFVLNLLHFLLDFGVLYALRLTPNFYEIHPQLQELCNVRCSIVLFKEIIILKKNPGFDFVL